MSSNDLIDELLRITPGSRLDRVRRHRTVARDNIQLAYEALFEPRDASELSRLERAAIATFVAGVHRQGRLNAHYANLLGWADGGPGIAAVIEAEIERGLTDGPYGSYPAGPLSAENRIGLSYAPSADNARFLGERLSAALTHAHLLVFRPRDASREALQNLKAAGFSTAGIVTLSQLVSFLAFQVRIVEGLSALAASEGTAESNVVTLNQRATA
jgi:CMD domain protein